MENDLSKIALMSGKLSGTKTFESTLNEKESLDDVETFFKNFIHIKIMFGTDNEVIYINDVKKKRVLVNTSSYNAEPQHVTVGKQEVEKKDNKDVDKNKKEEKEQKQNDKKSQDNQ